MKEVTLKLYKFDELDESAQRKVMDNNRDAIQADAMECYGYEYRDTLEKFSEVFGITVSEWEVSDYYHNFRFDFKDAIYDWLDGCLYAEDVSGKLLLRYLNGIHIKKAYSKNKYVQPFDQNADCPLTGMCYDYEILQPIVDWYKKPDYGITLYELIKSCLENFFQAWQDEYEYCRGDEFVRQELSESSAYEDALYTSDGTRVKESLLQFAA